MVRAWQESVRSIRSNLMAGIRTNSCLASDLLVELRRDAPDPLHRQISATIRDGIRSGRLGLGTSLPPTRAVAADLGVSRGVVVEAYQQLVAEGYLTSRAGGYTQVAIGPEAARPQPRPVPAPALRVHFRYRRAGVARGGRAGRPPPPRVGVSISGPAGPPCPCSPGPRAGAGSGGCSTRPRVS